MQYFAQQLLSDTELTENISQQIVCGDFTGDLTKVVKRTADIHRQKVVGHQLIQSTQHLKQGDSRLS